MIKYNPFSADSILCALLVLIYTLGKINLSEDTDEEAKAKARANLKFKPALEDFRSDPVGYYTKNQKAATKDKQFVTYPKKSIFRARKAPMCIWYAQSSGDGKTWNMENSDKVNTAIVAKFGRLDLPNVAKEMLNQLEGYISDPNAEKLWIQSLCEFGDTYGKEDILALVANDEKVQASLIAAMHESLADYKTLVKKLKKDAEEKAIKEAKDKAEDKGGQA